MTPKEKAQELYCKYADALNIRDLQLRANPYAKECALIAVKEILEVIEVIPNVRYRYVEEGIWLEVKTEIEAL